MRERDGFSQVFVVKNLRGVLRGKRPLTPARQGRFMLNNWRGDVVTLVRNGQVSWRYDYSAFGVERDVNGNPAIKPNNPFRFGMGYTDVESGLVYLRNRYLDPSIGRFITADPFWNIGNMQGSLAAMRQSSNLFVYVMNNPIRFVDPLGLWGKDIHRHITEVALGRISANNPNNPQITPRHAYYINIGNIRVDEWPYAAATNPFSVSAQSRHFDRSPFMPGVNIDSRQMWANHYMDLAVEIWLNADEAMRNSGSSPNAFTRRYNERVRALYFLGRGLHSIQDMEAHGNISINNPFLAEHVFRMGADNPEYEWIAGSNREQLERTGELIRFNISVNQSINYVSEFYRRIGIMQ